MATDTDFQQLAEEVDGPVLRPTDPGYDAECFTYNLLTPLRPVVAVGATSPGDVQAAIRFAARFGLAVAIRGGGHMQPYTAQDALLVTLDRLSGVTVDVDRATARVTGAARWSEVIDATTPYGLAPMSGSSTTVAVIGYALGGGQSPIFGRPHGYASDHVRSFDIVTADAQLRTVSAEAEPELFAALRGGKGNFGVVTAMEIALFRVTSVFAGGIYFPASQIKEVLHTWRDWAARLPKQATTSVAIQNLPPIDEYPEVLHGSHVVHVRYAYLGPAATGRALLEPMRGVGTRLLDTIAQQPYREAAALHNDPVGPIPYQDRSLGLAALPDEALETLVGLTGLGSGSLLASIELRALGGALDRVPARPDFVPSRGLPYQLFAFGVGDGALIPVLHDQLERLFAAMRPWADLKHRRMLNFLSPEEALDPHTLSEVYGADNYDRLLAIKQRFDPHTMFRMNHTVRPRQA
ncbi:FAD-linked oxidase [Asanoa ishikariensis]|uniref:FAD/FMN-containing dehydrogenase n=1 Tax=Asanoa ishikariensis TaxID=137265 RepID=A0A1H3U8J1_9ACTN|nr:FAD-binding oxidoreductase [Asanoa ishikariensis]GIF64103.1 FAD-linked oxidase [Asanoa ishikariensis]SDZ58607.1 FAD/FMN-containing dehydrogenase [Asanoa ishikariensis]